MKRNIKIFVCLFIILVALLGGAIALSKKQGTDKLLIVTTNFPAYDFARAVAGDLAEVKMLLKPGAEAHDFEPTPQDIIDIKNASMFVYVGGESEEWASSILRNINSSHSIKMMDIVKVIKEDDEDEYDEHVWTSPKNAQLIVNKIRDELSAIDSPNADKYIANANKYADELVALDDEFRDIVENAKRNILIFGDRFPLRYFAEEYGLHYLAAFPGCSEQTEASAKTIAALVDKIQSEQIPIVLKIELTSDKTAKAISAETGAKILTFNAAHNVSADDFADGITYIDLMNQNVDVLREALN